MCGLLADLVRPSLHSECTDRLPLNAVRARWQGTADSPRNSMAGFPVSERISPHRMVPCGDRFGDTKKGRSVPGVGTLRPTVHDFCRSPRENRGLFRHCQEEALALISPRAVSLHFPCRYAIQERSAPASQESSRERDSASGRPLGQASERESQANP